MKAVEPKKFNISLDKVSEIEVVRSFSRTVQLSQYNPINAFASYKAVMKAPTTNEDIEIISKELEAKAEADVFEQIDRFVKENTKPF